MSESVCFFLTISLLLFLPSWQLEQTFRERHVAWPTSHCCMCRTWPSLELIPCGHETYAETYTVCLSACAPLQQLGPPSCHTVKIESRVNSVWNSNVFPIGPKAITLAHSYEKDSFSHIILIQVLWCVCWHKANRLMLFSITLDVDKIVV